MGLIDNILGPNADKIFGPDVPKGPTFEQKVATAAKVAILGADGAPPANASNIGPFTEVNVLLNQLPGPGFGALASQGAPFEFHASGQGLVLKKWGTSPNTLLQIYLGGVLHQVAPGQRLNGPFSEFQVVKRNALIASDLRAAYSGVYQGEAQFIVEKIAGTKFEEPPQPYVAQSFRPVNLVGNLSIPGAGALQPASLLAPLTNGTWVTVGNGVTVTLPVQGFSKLAFYLTNASGAGSVVAGDVYSFNANQDPGILIGEKTYALEPSLVPHLIAPLWGATWGAQDTYYQCVDISGFALNTLTLSFVCTTNHTVGLWVLGVE